MPYLLLAAVVLGAVILPAPRLLGEWESFTVYSIFGAQDSPLTLAISPRGNVGGQGYAVLESSRRILDALGLPATLTTVRIPVILCGAVSLLVFFIIGKRWMGLWPALAATALLAVNPTFSQYSHELVVLGPSLMAFLIFLERLQYLTRHLTSLFTWLSLALSLSLVFILYGPGRIMAVTVLGLWSALVILRARPKGLAQALLAARVLGVLALSLVVLIVVYPRNIQMIGPQLLFPHNAESVLITDSTITLSETLATNARIAAESLLLGGGEYHSTFLEATLIQGRFPLLPLVIVPVVWVGLALCAIALLRRQVTLASKEGALLGLSAVTIAPMLLSSIFVIEGPAGPFRLASLVNFRLAYGLVPAYLLAGLAIGWLGHRRWPSRATGAMVPLTTSLVAVLIGVCALGAMAGRSSFDSRIASMDPALTGAPGQKQWLAGYALKDRSIAWGSHFQQHLQYLVGALQADDGVVDALSRNGRVVVWAPLRCFPEATLRTNSLGEIEQRNYHSVFLALYLNDALPSAEVGFVFIPPASAQPESRGEKTALWSATLTELATGEFDYADAGAPKLVGLNGSSPDVVVATTRTELAAARSLLGTPDPAILELQVPYCSGNPGS